MKTPGSPPVRSGDPRASRRSALLDRRLITEMAAYLSHRDGHHRLASDLGLVTSYGFSLYYELVIERTYSSTLQSMVYEANRHLADRLLFAPPPRTGLPEAFELALDDSAVSWSEDAPFQMVVGRYERGKGGGAAAAEAIEYVQHVLLASHTMETAIIPHRERWPVFQHVMEKCLWEDEVRATRTELQLAMDSSDVGSLPPYFGVPEPRPMSLVRYGPVPFPFPRALRRRYEEETLRGFGDFSFEFLAPGPRTETVEPGRTAVEKQPEPVSPGASFDVFISHNSRDKPYVIKIAEALRSRGVRVWLDIWELVPGRTWQDALEGIITVCRSAVVCVGESGLGPWEEPEMQALLRRFVKEKKFGTPVGIIPVMLPGAPDQVRLPLFLEAFTWVDLRNGLSTEGLDRLQWGINGVRPGAS
jgi:hypothetical protein